MNYETPRPGRVIDALKCLSGISIDTPLLRSERLNSICDGTVFLKCENLQRTGAFKFRGAYNCLSRLDRNAFPGGVVAYSTGNHGQAVATVARILGIKATIVMPRNAPATKIQRAKDQGANIVLYDRATESREEIAARLAAEMPVAIVPPGDHPDVIAGQGTIAAEALLSLGHQQVQVIAVPCGGGGLAAGTCLATAAFDAKAEVWIAEPIGFDDTKRSLESGLREQNLSIEGSICDALLAPTPAELTFSINRKRVSQALTVSDHQVLVAMRFAYEEFRIVVEPGGVVALASLLSTPGILKGKTAVVVLSGGNVDRALFRRAIADDDLRAAF
jgi:threonine dehydratase